MEIATSTVVHLVANHFDQMLEEVKGQLLFLICESIKSSARRMSTSIFPFIREINCADTSPGNLFLIQSIINMAIKYPSWVRQTNLLLPTLVCTLLRSIANHYNVPGLEDICRREIDLCLELMEADFTSCARIGRDFLRVLHSVSMVPEFIEFWQMMLCNDPRLHPSKNDTVASILHLRTQRKFLSNCLPHDLERMVVFVLSQGKKLEKCRHREWLYRKYFANYVHLRILTIRYICAAQEADTSEDTDERWKLVSWLFCLPATEYERSVMKFAIFFDWLLYDGSDPSRVHLDVGCWFLRFGVFNSAGKESLSTLNRHRFLKYVVELCKCFYAKMVEKFAVNVMRAIADLQQADPKLMVCEHMHYVSGFLNNRLLPHLPASLRIMKRLMNLNIVNKEKMEACGSGKADVNQQPIRPANQQHEIYEHEVEGPEFSSSDEEVGTGDISDIEEELDQNDGLSSGEDDDDELEEGEIEKNVPDVENESAVETGIDEGSLVVDTDYIDVPASDVNVTNGSSSSSSLYVLLSPKSPQCQLAKGRVYIGPEGMDLAALQQQVCEMGEKYVPIAEQLALVDNMKVEHRNRFIKSILKLNGINNIRNVKATSSGSKAWADQLRTARILLYSIRYTMPRKLLDAVVEELYSEEKSSYGYEPPSSPLEQSSSGVRHAGEMLECLKRSMLRRPLFYVMNYICSNSCAMNSDRSSNLGSDIVLTLYEKMCELMFAMSECQTRVSYLFLLYLRLFHYKNNHYGEYVKILLSQHRNGTSFKISERLSDVLTRALIACHADHQGLFLALTPFVFKISVGQQGQSTSTPALCNNPKVLYLLSYSLNPSAAADLCRKVMIGDTIMLKTQSVVRILEDSFSWSAYAQQNFWVLLKSHASIAADSYSQCVASSLTEDHGAALMNFLDVVRSRSPSVDLMKAVLSRRCPDMFSLAVLADWCTRWPTDMVDCFVKLTNKCIGSNIVNSPSSTTDTRKLRNKTNSSSSSSCSSNAKSKHRVNSILSDDDDDEDNGDEGTTENKGEGLLDHIEETKAARESSTSRRHTAHSGNKATLLSTIHHLDHMRIHSSSSCLRFLLNPSVCTVVMKIKASLPECQLAPYSDLFDLISNFCTAEDRGRSARERHHTRSRGARRETGMVVDGDDEIFGHSLTSKRPRKSSKRSTKKYMSESSGDDDLPDCDESDETHHWKSSSRKVDDGRRLRRDSGGSMTKTNSASMSRKNNDDSKEKQRRQDPSEISE